MRKLNLYISIVVISMMTSCKTNLDPTDVNAGKADFKRFVAIGNSLASGYADGALSKAGQMNSYPKMLAEQFGKAGSGDFKIPYMQEGGGNDGQGNPARVLGLVTPCSGGAPSLSPILNPAGATSLADNVAAQGPYNLIGVPGARAIDAIYPLYSAFNPFLKRYATTPGVSTMLTEALRVNPTFFTLWLGNNDVLLYAINGGPTPTPSPLTPKLSDTSMVRNALMQMVDTLTRSGAKGVIANVPDITSIPFFTTVPWNSVVISKGFADTLNLTFAKLGLSTIVWKEGANGLLIADSSALGGMRLATADDYILITTPGDSIRCGGWGVSPAKPLKDEYVLDKAEALMVKEYTNVYNKSIQDIAIKYDLGHVDMNAYLKKLQTGIVYNGITMNAKFVTGGAFSLDGVHPNPRGYALIANEFIRVINAKFGSTLSDVDLTKYKGVVFP
jgi:hypothetical protein